MSEPVYIVALYATRVLIARVSPLNLDRASTVLKNVPADGEHLEEWQSGTREEMLATFAEELYPEDFADADRVYKQSPTLQVMRSRVSRVA